MVYNLRSIGLSLMHNTDDEKDYHYTESSESAYTGVSASSLNNPSRPQQGTRRQIISKSQQNKKYDSSSSKRKSGSNSATTSRHMKTGSHEVSPVNTSMLKISADFNNNDNKSLNVSNNSETKMTTSETNISISHYGQQQPQQQKYRKSASVSCLEPSSSETKGGHGTTEPSADNKSLICPVLNCSAHFSSVEILQLHNKLFKHSPCNPVLLSKDSCLVQSPICYMCPKCDREFQTAKECKKHMVSENHLPFYPPLAVTAYMCAQCLHLFDSFEGCWNHLEKMSHHAVTYAFNDDQCSSSSQSGPVAVVSELVQDFIGRCNKVPYSLQCLECGLDIESSSKLHDHGLETNNQHTMASFTETTVVDVFASYLATYSCNVCHHLFSGELKELAKHQCAKNTIGTIVDNDSSSFSEFVKRCALTLIKPVEVADETSLPGPSRVNLQTRRLHWMDTIGDSDDAEASDGEIELKSNNGKVKYDELRKKNAKSKGSDSGHSPNKKGKSTVSKGATSQTKRVNSAYVERANSDDRKGVSMGGKKSVENSNDSETSGNRSVIILDDSSDTSDDLELFVNGSSKRKRKQKTSDSRYRNKQHAACDAQSISNGAKSKTGIGGNISSDTGSPLCINLIDDSPVPPDISARSRRQDRVTSKRSDATSTAVLGTSRLGTSQLSDYEEEVGTQSKAEILKTGGSKVKKADRIIIDVDSDEDLETSEPARAASPSGYSQSKAGTSSSQPSLTTQPSAGLAGSTPSTTSYMPTSPFAAFNFTPNSPQLSQNILTNNSIRQHLLNSEAQLRKVRGMPPNSITSPAPNNFIVPRPPRYFLRNSSTSSIEQPIIQTTTNNTHTAGQHPHVPPTAQQQGILSVRHPQNIPLIRQPGAVPSVGCPAGVQDLVSTDNLKRMKNIIFLDLDNWPSFFHKLPTCLPDLTFIWGFFGGKNCWFEPNRIATFRAMKHQGMFYLNERCGSTKDAADFAIVLMVGKMDERLPSNIAFTILSGDKGFIEVERQMKNAKRKVLVVNPHTAAQFSNDMIYALVTSITDS